METVTWIELEDQSTMRQILPPGAISFGLWSTAIMAVCGALYYYKDQPRNIQTAFITKVEKSLLQHCEWYFGNTKEHVEREDIEVLAVYSKGQTTIYCYGMPPPK